MILHLMTDDKFTDCIIDQFEAVAPNKSIYFIEVKSHAEKRKYVKSNHKNIIFDSALSEKYLKLTENLETYCVVILHNIINFYKQKLVAAASEKIRFHWMCWGYDFYNLKSSQNLYLSYESQKYISNSRNMQWYFKTFVKKINLGFYYRKMIKSSTAYNHKNYKDLFIKVQSFTTVVPNEAEIINQALKTNMTYIPLKYGDLNSLIRTSKEFICYESNFFIGNSATPSSNHLEAIKLLNSLIEPTQKIYLPLSYGDEQYAEYIKKESQKLNNNLIFLEEFIDNKSYNEILLKCGNVIMNHYRQQAMGNILMALYNGARVFLNIKNPIFDYLSDEGFLVFNLEKDLAHIDTLPSFGELAKHNRPFLERLYSREQVLKETKQFVELFTEN